MDWIFRNTGKSYHCCKQYMYGKYRPFLIPRQFIGPLQLPSSWSSESKMNKQMTGTLTSGSLVTDQQPKHAINHTTSCSAIGDQGLVIKVGQGAILSRQGGPVRGKNWVSTKAMSHFRSSDSRNWPEKRKLTGR